MIQPRRADDCPETQLVPMQLLFLVVRTLGSLQEAMTGISHGSYRHRL